MEVKTKKSCCSCRGRSKGCDLYGEVYPLPLDSNGTVAFRSFCGVLWTLLGFLIVLAFTARKGRYFYEREDPLVQETIDRAHYSLDDTLSADNGLMVAAAISGGVLPPQVGSIKFFEVEWNKDTNLNDYTSYRNEIKTKPCS